MQFAVITLQLYEAGLLLLESSVTVGRLPPTTDVELTDVVIDTDGGGGTGGGGGGGGGTAPTATLSASTLSVASNGYDNLQEVSLTIAFSGGTAQLFVTAVDDGTVPASVTPNTDITPGASVTAGTRTVGLGAANNANSHVTITLRVTSTSGAVASSAVTIFVAYDQ
jgi:hypothetical protein